MLWLLRIAIGSDHAGFEYKEKIKTAAVLARPRSAWISARQHAAGGLSTFHSPTAEAVARGDVERGIVLGGSGNGEAIVANKVHGVRCALCWSLETARLARQHNDSNVLSLGRENDPRGFGAGNRKGVAGDAV